MSREIISPNDRMYRVARNFIDTEFLSHTDQDEVKFKVAQATAKNSVVTPNHIKGLYCLNLKQSLETHQDHGLSLRKNATNLAVLKTLDSTLPIEKRIITIQDEITLFRNSLIAEISSKVQSIEVSIAATGSETRIDFLRSICNEDFRICRGLNLIAAEIEIQEKIY